MPYDVKEVILSYLEEWKAASKKAKNKGSKQEVLLSWSKPPKGFFKINVDGARNREGCIGAGGVLRDYSGAWCAGFMVNLGAGDVLQAEAWALLHGLQMGIREGAVQVVVETDSAILANLVLNDDISVHPLGTIVQNCRHLMSDFAICTLNHVKREKNCVADILAKFSLGCSLGVCYLKEAPVCCFNAVIDDLCGKGQFYAGHKQSTMFDENDSQERASSGLVLGSYEQAESKAVWCSRSHSKGDAATSDPHKQYVEDDIVDMGRHMRTATCCDPAVSTLHNLNAASLSRLSVSNPQDAAASDDMCYSGHPYKDYAAMPHCRSWNAD